MDKIKNEKAQSDQELSKLASEKEHLLKKMKSSSDMVAAQQKKEANRVEMMQQ